MMARDIGPDKARDRARAGRGNKPAAEKRSCAVSGTLAELGDRWMLLIVWCLLNGLQNFDDIQKELAIARNILANRLVRLVETGLLEREVEAADRRRVRYQLTEKGRELAPLLAAVQAWSDRWRR